MGRVHRPAARPRAPRLGLFVVSASVLLAGAALVTAGAATGALLDGGHRHTRVFAVLAAAGASGLLVHGLTLRALIAAIRARRVAGAGGPAGVLAAGLAVAVAAVRPLLLLLATVLVGDQTLAILAFLPVTLNDLVISGLARGAVSTPAVTVPAPR